MSQDKYNVALGGQLQRAADHGYIEAKKGKVPARKSNSYPPIFLQLYLQVANTGNSLTIDTLPNTRSSYVSFRARINEFRYAYRYEAIMENDTQKLQIADAMYSVVTSDPQCIDGKWSCAIRQREHDLSEQLGAALNKSLANVSQNTLTNAHNPNILTGAIPTPDSENPPATMSEDELFGLGSSKGASAIKHMFGEGEGE